jgi:hypothetical protein
MVRTCFWVPLGREVEPGGGTAVDPPTDAVQERSTSERIDTLWRRFGITLLLA